MTLDDDVAVALERVQAEQGATFRQVLNDAIREGLAARTRRAHRAPGPAAATKGRKLGPRLGHFDNTSELIALIEGELHK